MCTWTETIADLVDYAFSCLAYEVYEYISRKYRLEIYRDVCGYLDGEGMESMIDSRQSSLGKSVENLSPSENV